MVNEDYSVVKEINAIKFSMSIDGTQKTPVGRASHITDGSDATTTQAAVNAVLVVLEDLGFVATS